MRDDQNRRRNSGKTRAPRAECPHFGPCGGCSLLDLDYREEVLLKSEAFARMAAGSPAMAHAVVLPLLAAQSPRHYRTALKVPFARGKRGVVAGFFERGSHKIVDLETCAIQDPRLTRVLLDAKEIARRLDVSIYDERRHVGLLRHLVARVGPGSGEILVGLVVREGGTPAIAALARELFARGAEHGVVGVRENGNTPRTNAVLGRESRVLQGKDVLVESQDGLVLRTSLKSFAQVNAAQASVLFAEVARMLAPLEGKRIADVYSGYGPIALRLAREGAQVTAIERNADAVEEGKRAAEENGLAQRVTFIAGDAEHGLSRLDADGLDAIVVDPPRRGLAPGMITTLKSLAAPALVYVSCDPNSLARDLEALADAFAVRALRPVDLFPRTEHIETIALLSRA